MTKIAVNNELMEVLHYALTYYRDDEFKCRLNTLEYFAFTELSPLEFATVARECGYDMISRKLVNFYYKSGSFFYNTSYDKMMNVHYQLKGKVLTLADKDKIYNILVNEEMPILSGVCDFAMRKYALDGEEALDSKNIRAKVINAYNEFTGSDLVEVNGRILSSSVMCLETEGKVLTKTI